MCIFSSTFGSFGNSSNKRLYKLKNISLEDQKINDRSVFMTFLKYDRGLNTYFIKYLPFLCLFADLYSCF